MGQTARFERYMADLMHFVASGRKIDPEKSPKFITQIEKMYRNPFEKKDLRSADEIKAHIIGRIKELRRVKKDGSAEAGGED